MYRSCSGIEEEEEEEEEEDSGIQLPTFRRSFLQPSS